MRPTGLAARRHTPTRLLRTRRSHAIPARRARRARVNRRPTHLLRPGDEGTVVRHDEALDTVDIAWDNGSRLSMCTDAGDRIRRLPADTDGVGPAGKAVR